MALRMIGLKEFVLIHSSVSPPSHKTGESSSIADRRPCPKKSALRSLLIFTIVYGTIIQSVCSSDIVQAGTVNPQPLGTPISGVISISTNWDLAGSPYWIEGNTTLSAGFTLTIDPGVRVLFNKHYGLYIDGELLATGESDNPIVFDSNLSDPALRDWTWVRFNPNSKGHITDSEIKHASSGVSVLSSNITVANLTIHNVQTGIWLHNPASGNVIKNNIIYDVGSSGISLTQASNNRILNNTVWNATRGISYDVSERDYFEGNHASECTMGFAIMVGASNFTLFNNTFSNNDLGIRIWESNQVDIRNNTILDSTVDGLLITISDFLNVTGNNVSSSGRNGIHVIDSGNITLTGNDIVSSISTGLKLVRSEDIHVFGNKFIDNKDQGEDDSASRFWNASYPTGGNYWSNYNGRDRYSGPNQDEPNPDGIGDRVYWIDANALDRYPLMWSPNLDSQPPEISNVTLDGKPSLEIELGKWVTIQAFINDSATGNTTIKKANYTIGEGSWPGNPMSPIDFEWNSPEEQVYAVLSTTTTGVGTFQIYVYAEDDNWNENTTGTYATLIVIQPDENPPSITSIQTNPNPQFEGGYVNISANVNDESDLDSVSVRVSGPSGFVGNLSMQLDTGTGRHFHNTSHNEVGDYSCTIWAGDNAGNWASSPEFYFRIISPDDVPPVANAGSDIDTERRTLATLNGTESQDNINVENYTWTFFDEIQVVLYGEITTYTFSNVGNFLVELNVSDAVGNWDSDSVWINVTDTTSPPAPDNLAIQADEANGSLILHWSHVQVDDLQRYDVFRSITSGAGYELVGSVDNCTNSFVDSNISSGTKYYYVLTAVDHWENSSPFSEEVDGILPKPADSTGWMLALFAVIIVVLMVLLISTLLLWRRRNEKKDEDRGR